MKLKVVFASLAILASVIAPVAIGVHSARAAAIDNTPDCDNYAVMWCGGFTMNKIVNKYENGDGHSSAKNIQSIFSQVGISAAEVKASGFVDGVVYENGTVVVKGKVVARDAKTYIRTMGVVPTSKMATPQTAFVKLNSKGQFMYAIMKPCGNPVKARNVVPEPKPPKPQPVQALVCDDLVVHKFVGRKVSATVKSSTKNGATVTGYTIDFGDGTKVTKKSANHTYKKDGTYVISATVTGMANGKKVTVGGAHCKEKVTFKADKPVCPTNPNLPPNDPKCNPQPPVEPPVTPPTTPEQLPNTGAGSMLGLFAATSAISSFGYKLWLIRRGGL
jgi:PKD repeat protein